MTKKDLIDLLNDPAKQIPDDAIMLAFDGDIAEVVPIQGFIYGKDKEYGFTVEFTTQENE